MKNPICKHEFCWLCLQPYTEDHYKYGPCKGKQFEGMKFRANNVDDDKCCDRSHRPYHSVFPVCFSFGIRHCRRWLILPVFQAFHKEIGNTR